MMIKAISVGLIVGLIILSILECGVPAKESPSEIMYFLLIDRFVDGDPDNNTGNTPESYFPFDGSNPGALKHYQGGDIAGVIQNLDSLQALGITMIWISPFVDNSNTDYVGWWPYHGYHPIDFYQVDEHFGTLDDLKALVKSSHELGMKIIFDMPFNQTAQDHPWIGDTGKEEWFHLDANQKPYAIDNWFDQDQIERGELHGLPDLAQENQEVSDYLYEVSKYWIDETGCDGFRLDAVKHIPISFWKAYNARIKAYARPDFLLMGEVFWGEAERIQPYSAIGFDYLFDIPGYYAIRNTFNKGGSIKGFSNFYATTSDVLTSTSFATLIDNHDVARFNVGLGDDAWQKQLLALGWLMTAPGLPVIYSGTEIGLQGYPVLGEHGEPQDFLNRIPFPKSLNPEQIQRKSEFIRLTQLRQKYPAFSRGAFTEIYKDWSVYAFLRSHQNQHFLVVLNNAATEEFIAIPKIDGLSLDKSQPVYGEGVLRPEGDEWWVRLTPNNLTVWQLEGRIHKPLPTWTTFTDRLSGDYQMIRFFYIDPTIKNEAFEVAGDFNNWTPEHYFSFSRNDTIFIDIPLKPGMYNYKFVLNGEKWIADPYAPEYLIDPYGGRNSVVRVSLAH